MSRRLAPVQKSTRGNPFAPKPANQTSLSTTAVAVVTLLSIAAVAAHVAPVTPW